jgi:hypothetical protein
LGFIRLQAEGFFPMRDAQVKTTLIMPDSRRLGISKLTTPHTSQKIHPTSSWWEDSEPSYGLHIEI